MSRTGDISLEYTGIGNLLSTRHCRVPRYQRAYAWEKAHVGELLQDIQSAIADTEPEYFLGSVVATSMTSTAVEIVDGQQRLATVSMIIAAIRDWFLDHNDEDSAVQLETEFLYKKDRRTKEISPRLRLNDADNEFFICRVLSRPRTEERAQAQPVKGSHRRIALAAEQTRETIDQVALTSTQSEDRLNDLVDYIQDRVKVIWLRTTDESNAFVIFETLNDRGLDLAISDLLKNYLFSLVGDRIEEVQQHWVGMMSTLEAVSGDSMTTEFLRHYWSSHHGPTRKQDLFSDIKRKTRTKSGALKLSKSLEHTASLYSAMLNPDHELWKQYAGSVRTDMVAMNNLGMVQIRPLILAALDVGLPKKEIQKAFSAMVSWGVRFLIVGGLGGGTLERHYSDAAQSVRAAKVTSASLLQKQLASVLPQDKEFEEAFSVARVAKANLARFYLTALESNAISGSSGSDSIPNPNTDIVNLEHVLPKTFSTKWQPTFDAELHAAYFRRLGNLVLLSSTDNSVAGNESFSMKRKMFQDSSFLLTRMIGAQTDWSPQEIDERQKQLAAYAVRTWPLKGVA